MPKSVEVPRIRSAYDGSRVRVVKDYSAYPSLAKQSMKDECDINRILAQYDRTGVLTHARNAVPQYANVADVGDYRTALNQVLEAERHFMQLPSGIRARFGNDPALFLDAFADPERHDELVELGLLKKPAAPSAAPVDPPVAPEVAAGDGDGGSTSD